jgi:hypothetical protein
MANSVGKPLMFGNKEELKEKIDAYFEATDDNEYTITGLALALDTCRQTLINYAKKPEYVDTIKKAKTRVEHSYELTLRRKGDAGSIFGLKNFGWKDKQEVTMDLTQHTSKLDDLIEQSK